MPPATIEGEYAAKAGGTRSNRDCDSWNLAPVSLAVAKLPQVIVGVDFDEPFFDAVVRRAGGERLEVRYKPPQDTKNVDYLIHGWALELKILMADPLDAKERQARLKQFFDKNFPRGYIWVTANRQAAALTGELANEYWERFLGKPAQGRLEEAAAQIAATRTFVQAAEARRGGVLIVNAAGWSLDWQSFFKLCGHYHQRFSEIDAVFPFNALPSPSATGPQIQFCGVSKKTPDPDLDFLYEKLSEALRTEIE